MTDEPKPRVIYENPDGSGDRMDHECIPICNALNRLEGITTIASCCGHEYAAFRVYFTAEHLSDLKPILAAIDESEVWLMRCSMATGNMEIYFVLEGKIGAFIEANQLAERLVHTTVS